MAQRQQFNFGVGRIFVKPPGDNPTPIPIGTVQEGSLEIMTNQVVLHGEKQFPVDVARGKGEIKGKLKYGSLNADLFNSILAGSEKTSGTVSVVAETSAIPGTPYQITVDNGADFVEDFGVIDNNTGLPMTRVDILATPTTGQYTVDEATGEYTFAAADTTHSVTITYGYALTTGNTVEVTNPLMGAGVNYQLVIANTYKGLSSGFKLWAVIIEKLAMAIKNDSHTLTDSDFSAFEDDQGRLMTRYGGI